MPEHKDSEPIRDQVHIVLYGPDGKVKDERKPQEVNDEDEDRHEVQE